MERTFVMMKPDAVERRLVGEILRRFESKGFRIVAMKMVNMSVDLAEKHYAAHKGKPFYEPLIEFTVSGPVVAMVVEADDAIALTRRMMGSLDPMEAEPGTIRGDFTVDTRRNLIHGADSPEAAQREIALWFPELE